MDIRIRPSWVTAQIHSTDFISVMAGNYASITCNLRRKNVFVKSVVEKHLTTTFQINNRFKKLEDGFWRQTFEDGILKPISFL